jgi:outer membrane protein insertion porin family
MPVVNAPFRVYYAYNPSVFQGVLQAPVVVDRSMFPNEVSYQNAVALIGQATPYDERKSLFRFSVGRTF